MKIINLRKEKIVAWDKCKKKLIFWTKESNIKNFFLTKSLKSTVKQNKFKVRNDSNVFDIIIIIYITYIYI